MQLSESNGRYILRAREHRWPEFRDAGWVFNRIERVYTTTDWRKAVAYIEWADCDELWDDLDRRMTELEAAMSASYSMFADADITRPHITNHKGEVLDYLPYQKAGILYAAERDDTLIGDSPGLGKGEVLWAKVLTPTGWTTMGELRVGDPIIGSDGQTHHVTGVYDKGVLPVYRVEFNDGAVTHVDADHLWKVRRRRIQRRDKTWYEPEWEILETRDLLARAYPGGIKDNKIEIPLVAPVHYAPAELPLDPYVVGALLGDGGLSQKSVHFTNADQSVLYQVATRLPKGYVVRHSSRYTYLITHEEPRTRGKPNAISTTLRELGIMPAGADNKKIPEIYLRGTPEQRLLLLQGLMDTDGYVAKDGTTQFSSNSKALRDGVVEIVMSLGGTARKMQKISASGKDHFITTMNVPVCPFLCWRKVDRWKPRIKYVPKRIFKEITELPPEPVRCISVSAPDQLYVTDDFIVTHNTIQAIGLINHLGLQSGVVVCPATLKLNWLKEMTKWLADKSLTVGVAYGGEIPDTDFVIINYDILHRNKDTLWAEHWDILICDEAQYLSNGESKRTQTVFGTYKMDWGKKKVCRVPQRIKDRHLKKVIKVPCLRANTRLMLTGTPMMKQPKDMWTIIRDFDPDDLGASWDDFAFTYCDAVMTGFGLQANGGSNLSELNEKLRRKFMIRRLKSNVLKDLPRKTREVVIFPPEGLKKLIKTERDKFTDALAMLDAANTGIKYEKKLALEEVDPGLILDTMTMILPEGFDAPEIEDLEGGEIQPGFAAYSEARRDLALSKIPMAAEHIKRLVDAGEKVIVFGIHKDVISELHKHFPTAARIVGGMGDKKVEAEKLRFQGDKDAGIEPDPECNVILCNLKAGGVGHTLTEATVVVFVEMWSVPGDMEQCEDRCISEGQLILTPSGWEKIETIKVGDWVIGGSGKACRVIDAWSKCSTKNMVEIMVDGWPVPVVSTEDHQFLLNDGRWVMASDLTPGDIVAQPKAGSGEHVPILSFDESFRLPLVRHRNGTMFRNGRARPAPDELRLDEETLFVLGFFIGDGFASTKKGKGRFISFAGHQEKDADAHNRITTWAQRYNLGQPNIRVDPTGLGMERRFYSAEMAYWFADLFGTGTYNKRVPDLLMNLDSNQTRWLLTGLVSSDGYRRGNRVEFVTVSRTLAAQVFILATRLGLSPCVTIGSKLQWSIQWSEEGSYAGRVKTVLKRARKRPDGSPSYERVYDLTVENDASFVVGRSVVHNCHRIGLEHNVLIQFLVVDGTIDALTIQTLVERIAMIQEGIDGVEPEMRMGR